MFLLLSVSATERGFFVLFIFKGKKSQRTCLENCSLKSDIVELVVTGLGLWLDLVMLEIFLNL